MCSNADYTFNSDEQPVEAELRVKWVVAVLKHIPVSKMSCEFFKTCFINIYNIYIAVEFTLHGYTASFFFLVGDVEVAPLQPGALQTGLLYFWQNNLVLQRLPAQ